MRDKIRERLLENIRIKERLMRDCIGQIIEVVDCLTSCLKRRGKVIFFGNGGSASDSIHLAAEFVGRFQKERDPLPAIALTSNTSILTALANDYGYETVFARQVQAIANKDDVIIGISTSGRARNVTAGIKKAKQMGLFTVVFTGEKGTDLAKLANTALIVPSSVTARIQEAHITIGHIICELVEEILFNDQG